MRGKTLLIVSGTVKSTDATYGDNKLLETMQSSAQIFINGLK